LRLQLGPAHELAVVDPLGDDSDRADHAAAVGINLIGGGGNVICAAGAYGLDGGHNIFLLFIAHALDLAIDLLGSGHTAAGRIHMNNDGFDRVVVSELAQLLYSLTRVEDDAFEVHHPDLVAKGVNAGLPPARLQRQENQGEDCEHKKKEGPASDQDPEPDARACVFSHKCE